MSQPRAIATGCETLIGLCVGAGAGLGAGTIQDHGLGGFNVGKVLGTPDRRHHRHGDWSNVAHRRMARRLSLEVVHLLL
jgi:hypothetical protein